MNPASDHRLGDNAAAAAAIACATGGLVAICVGDRRVRGELKLSNVRLIEVDAATNVDEILSALEIR